MSLRRFTLILSSLLFLCSGVLINSYRFVVPAASDPNFSSVSLLVHMQGANNGTAFTDSSSNAFALTASGNAKTSTANFKWGNSSGLFDGNGDYVTAPASSKFNFGFGAFTAEWWVNFTTVSYYQYFFDMGPNQFMMRLLNGTTLLTYAGGAPVLNTNITTLTSGVWYHMAYVRTSSGVFTLYVNGVSVATATNTTHASGDSTSTLRIGEYAGGTGFGLNGNLQDFRITWGVARYLSNFTPPTAQFPDS